MKKRVDRERINIRVILILIIVIVLFIALYLVISPKVRFSPADPVAQAIVGVLSGNQEVSAVICGTQESATYRGGVINRGDREVTQLRGHLGADGMETLCGGLVEEIEPTVEEQPSGDATTLPTGEPTTEKTINPYESPPPSPVGPSVTKTSK